MEQRLRAARAQLVLQHPFLGALLLKLGMREDERCNSIATNGIEIRYKPGFFRTMSLTDIQFHLTHQVLHCALGHPWRRGHRLSGPWDAACDFAVNQLLRDEGFKLLSGAKMDDRFRGLSAEEIYPLLALAENRVALDDHQWQSTVGQSGSWPAYEELIKTVPDEFSGELTRIELQSESDVAQKWQSDVTHITQTLRSKGHLSASLQRALDAALQPILPWQAILARFLASYARDDYSFHRISRRGGEAILPSLHSEQINLVVAIDTSGSITDAEIGEFLVEIDALKSQVRAEVCLLACDVALHTQCPWRFAATEGVLVPEKLSGGGGTRFTPVFSWVENQGPVPDALIYFTDAMGEFPEHEPTYPVLWLVKGRGRVPWGTRIQLN